jgi:glucose 1-dehydrogenase
MKVVVTGVSAGIGGGISDLLSIKYRDALSLAMCVRQPSEYVESLAAACRGRGSKVSIIQADLSHPEIPADVIEQAATEFGGLGAIVSNAGVVRPAPLEALELSVWDETFAVDCRASWLLAKAALPRGQSRQLRRDFISIGNHPHRGTGTYSCAKAALSMLCRQLAIEWGLHGIRVNSISPGMIRTPLTEDLYQDENILKARQEIVPLHTIGTTADVAHLVDFLISPTNAYVTGQDIGIDGGLQQTVLDRIPGIARKPDLLPRQLS